MTLTLAERQAAGLAGATPVTPLAGPIPTVWCSDGIAAGWTLAADLITRTQPPAVQLHTWSPDRVASKVRAVVPGARLVVGVGVDGVARHVAKGDWSVAKGVSVLTDLADRARDVGAEALCWNAEAGWKTPPSTLQRERIEELVRNTLAEVGSVAGLDQWHTAYDHPTYHSTYPWAAWVGRDSPVTRSLPQVYAAPEGAVMAHVGALPRREAAALSSWAAAIRAGWIRRSDACLWSPYYQLHHVAAVDTVRSAMTHDLCALWALPTRADAAGREALTVLCAAWRAGLWGDVKALQRAVGVADDGAYGPLSHAAVVAWAARQ